MKQVQILRLDRKAPRHSNSTKERRKREDTDKSIYENLSEACHLRAEVEPVAGTEGLRNYLSKSDLKRNFISTRR